MAPTGTAIPYPAGAPATSASVMKAQHGQDDLEAGAELSTRPAGRTPRARRRRKHVPEQPPVTAARRKGTATLIGLPAHARGFLSS